MLIVIESYVDFAQRYLVANPHEAYRAISNAPPSCRATTRKGTPCMRTPLPRNGYCPSHQHLADTEHRRPRRVAPRRAAARHSDTMS